jgi:UDP-N-acetylglucosamine acyltransferase
MASIHSTAIVDPRAQVADTAEIGPYCIVGGEVRIGAGTRLMSHVVIDGCTTIGEGCTVFPFASLGTRTQDLKFKGGRPRVEIGNRTTIREYVTVNQATFDGGLTRVGDDCLLMACSHVAHDCLVGNRVIMANAAGLAGHVIVEDQAIIGGITGVHQFVRIGRLAIIGGCSKVVKDVPPFMMAEGNPLEVSTLNLVGLERAGIPDATVQAMKQAFRILYRQNLNTTQALERLRAEIPEQPEIAHLLSFVEASERGITK